MSFTVLPFLLINFFCSWIFLLLRTLMTTFTLKKCQYLLLLMGLLCVPFLNKVLHCIPTSIHIQSGKRAVQRYFCNKKLWQAWTIIISRGLPETSWNVIKQHISYNCQKGVPEVSSIMFAWFTGYGGNCLELVWRSGETDKPSLSL